MNHRYTKEFLEPIVLNSLSWAEVCRKVFGKESRTGNQTHIKRVATRFNIPFSHFIGSGWRKGNKTLIVPIESYLSNERYISSHALKLKLFRLGIKKEICEICERVEWNEEKIPLELDHKDSNHQNNKIENLQIVCPNCHAAETRKRQLNRCEIGVMQPRHP